MKTVSHEEINEYLTCMCCFVDEDDGWAKNKAAQAQGWTSRSAVAKHIKNLMRDAKKMRPTLTPQSHKSSL